MMRKDRLFGLLGMICLLATGCFSYGPYGHPGTFAPPHTAMVPQPYGTMPAPTGAVWVPASPTGAASGSPALTAPNPARKPAPTTLDADEEPAGKSVPEPSDPQKSALPEVEPTGFDKDASLERRGVKTSQRPRPRPLANEEFTNTPTALESELAEPEAALASDDEPSLPTSRVRSAEFTTQVRSNAVTPASAVSDKFGYDAESYAWLKGIIEFDPKLKVWHLTYSETPDDDDQFGGEVTLKNTTDFRFLRSGESVHVEGRFDPTQRDRLGKPLYEVVRMNRNVRN